MNIQYKTRCSTSVLFFLLVCFALIGIILNTCISTASAKSTTTYQGISSAGKCNENGWTTKWPWNHLGAPDIALTRPEYAEVDPKNPIRTIEGTIVETLISHEDVPWTHTSHDFNWLVKLDRNYANLNSHGNRNSDGSEIKDSDTVDKKVMEMEWEIGTANDGIDDRFPKEFWPSNGDRVWMIGRYIFDCGHPDTGPRSELHPAIAVAFTHFEPLILGSPGSEPIFAAKTSIYIHGEGGPIYSAPVGGRSYEFNVTLPPKPSPSSKLLAQIMNTPFGGPQPIITGPFSNPGSSDNYVHVKYDLTSMPPSPKNKFGAHIAAGWTDPPQKNVYHYLTVSFDSVTKTPAKTPRGLGSISARLSASHIWDNLWVNVNGQYVDLLNHNNGFKRYTDTDKKILTSSPTVNTIVAEHGLGSTLNISTTGWIRSTAHNDNCFGQFDTIDLRDKSDLLLAARCASGATGPESLGSVDQTFSIGNEFERMVTMGPHIGICSERNLKFGPNPYCEFTLDFSVKDGGLINVSAPTTPIRPVNHAPVALDQHVTTEANKQVQVALGATDIDLDDSLSAAIVTPPHPDHGSVGQIDQNTGKVTYTPAPGFSGNDSFAFKVTDSHQAGSNVATVSITILPSPKPSPIPTPTVTCDPKSKTIQNGAKGAKVIELQTDLTALGYGELLGKHGPKQVGIDGIFGDDTKKAVIKFQQDNHLKKIDGIVGPETWGAFCALLSPVKPSSNVKETMHNFHQIIFVTPTDGNQENLATTYHQAALEQEASLRPQSENISDSFQEPENETDFPVGDFQALSNLTEAELEHLATNAMTPPENATQAATRLNATIPGEQAPTNETIPPENATPPIIEAPATNVTAPPPTAAPGEQPFCTDGLPPDPSNGLCADGLPPPPAANVTALPPAMTTAQQPVCSDGNPPDPSTGLCADGLPPPPAANVTAPPPTAAPGEQPFCTDGNPPDPSTGLCADGSQPQSFGP